MPHYPIHTIESAPAASRASLERLHAALGRVPNLAATMAGSPVLINAFVGAFGNSLSTRFSGAERQVLLLANAVANRSAWAVAFHSTLALAEGVADDDVEAIRAGRTPAEPRTAALAALTRTLIETRGHVARGDVEAFVAAGFGDDQVLDVIGVLAVSLLANYAGNVTDPPLEEPFAAQRWTASAAPRS